MNDRQVVITGVGAMGAKVDNPDALWKCLLSGGYAFPGKVDVDIPLQNKTAYVAEQRPSSEEDQNRSRADWMALETVKQALIDAGLVNADKSRYGVYYGTAMGSIDNLEKKQSECAKNISLNARNLFRVSEVIAGKWSCFGMNQMISTACAAGLYSIGLAARKIEEGVVDVMIVGGTEICSRIALSCFNRLGGLDGTYCRPFDRDREGTLFGEGAATLILESRKHYEERQGSSAYATVAGYGWSCDGHHATAPESDGRQIKRSAEQALSSIEGKVDEIDCIFPHGTGTKLNDEVEFKIMSELFKVEKNKIPWIPIKALLGHSAGSAGALSAVAAALTIKNKTIPAAFNVECPEFPINLPKDSYQMEKIRNVMINGYGFGGNNSSLLFGAYSE
jgi:3-oxoacyl-(acyl-carrier-protein) synthase